MGFKISTSVPARSDLSSLANSILTNFITEGIPIGGGGSNTRSGTISIPSSRFDLPISITGTTTFSSPFQTTPSVVCGNLIDLSQPRVKRDISVYSPSLSNFSYLVDDISLEQRNILLDSSVGLINSMLVVDGNPATMYTSSNATNIRFIRSVDVNGSQWGSPQSILTPGINPGQDGLTPFTPFSFKTLVGSTIPALAYGSGSGSIRFKKSDDGLGSGWTTPSVQVFASGNNPSLQVVNGNPSVACVNNAGTILFIRADDPEGTQWPLLSQIPVLELSNANFLSLEILNGNPVIFFNTNSNTLQFVRSTDSLGTAWGSVETVPGVSSSQFSIKIVNNIPFIAFRDGTQNTLKFIKSTDSSVTSWSSPTTLDSTINSGINPSLSIIDGIPSVSYRNSPGLILFVKSSDSSGNAWGTPSVVETLSGVDYPSLVELQDGTAGLTYINGISTNLSYVRNSPLNIDFSFIASV